MNWEFIQDVLEGCIEGVTRDQLNEFLRLIKKNPDQTLTLLISDAKCSKEHAQGIMVGIAISSLSSAVRLKIDVPFFTFLSFYLNTI